MALGIVQKDEKYRYLFSPNTWKKIKVSLKLKEELLKFYEDNKKYY
jgi:hypothetical protein